MRRLVIIFLITCYPLLYLRWCSTYSNALLFKKKIVFLVFLPSFDSSLFTLGTNKSFIRYMLCEYCIQSVACLYIHLTVSFKEQTFLILMKSNLSIFPCTGHAFDVISEKTFPNPKSLRFSRMSSSLLRVLGFTYSCMIHFELNLFVIRERVSKWNHANVTWFPERLFCSIDPSVYPLATPRCLCDCRFIMNLKVGGP